MCLLFVYAHFLSICLSIFSFYFSLYIFFLLGKPRLRNKLNIHHHSLFLLFVYVHFISICLSIFSFYFSIHIFLYFSINIFFLFVYQQFLFWYFYILILLVYQCHHSVCLLFVNVHFLSIRLSIFSFYFSIYILFQFVYYIVLYLSIYIFFIIIFVITVCACLPFVYLWLCFLPLVTNSFNNRIIDLHQMHFKLIHGLKKDKLPLLYFHFELVAKRRSKTHKNEP